jgi:hypothetical protein
MPGTPRELAVGDGFAESHGRDRLPHRALEGRAVRRERDCEADFLFQSACFLG